MIKKFNAPSRFSLLLNFISWFLLLSLTLRIVFFYMAVRPGLLEYY